MELNSLIEILILLVSIAVATPRLNMIRGPSAGAAAALPARQIKDCNAPDAACTCNEWTFSQTNFFVSDFVYFSFLELLSPPDRDGDGDKGAFGRGFLSFSVRNKALPYITNCHGNSTSPTEYFDGSTWYPCDGRGADLPGLTWYRYDKGRDLVEVKQTWLCKDGAGLKFEAEGNVTAKSACSVSEWQNDDWNEGETYNYNTTSCRAGNDTLSVPWSSISGSNT